MDASPSLMIDKPLPPTEKLFNEDPYIKQVEATVIFVQGPYVVTDKTVFYAESGGQASDTGMINGLKVVDVAKRGGNRLVVKKEGIEVPAVTIDTTIVHMLAEDAPFKIGDKVNMEIDWPRRYNLMRYHSASHFLYYAAHKVYDKEGDEIFTKGCSISDEGARFDFFGDIDGARIPEVEKIANDLISAPAIITMEAEALTKDIHYWRCGNIVIPCGGTHVRSTEELAPIKVKRTKKGQNTTRLSGVFI
ncbi:MAG: alanyl-tRNA editing protein [Alphaproteobacteria bacterium]|nr:alanyl-tRNA editing protein [Alphaproteobacteria bacterium]